MLESPNGAAIEHEGLITQSAFAKQEGKSRQYINKLVKKLSIETHGPKKLIKPADARKAIAESSDPARAHLQKDTKSDETDSPNVSTPSTSGNQTFNDAKTRQAVAKAEIDELNLQQLQGTLVNKEAVQREIFDLFRKLRDKMLNFPAQCADEVVILGTEREVATALEEKINHILNDFSEEIAKANE